MPCPVVIRPSQTNMIEPRATLQWRQGHSLLLIVRNENPSIRRDSCSIYIFRLAAVVLDVPRKRVANTPRWCFGLPAECKSEGRSEKMAAVRPCCAAGSLVAELPGERLLQSVLGGRNQAGATSCLWRARTSRRLLASPGTVRPRDQPCHNSSSPVISPRLGRALCITGGRLDCRARE